MAVAGLVVHGRATLQGIGDGVQVDGPGAVVARGCGIGGGLEGVEGDPGVTVGDVDEVGHGVWGEGHLHVGKTKLGVVGGPANYGFHLPGAQALEGKDPAAGQEGADYLEGGVLGGGSDEGLRCRLPRGEE